MKRKLIDIPEDVFSILSKKAMSQGTNLKKFIEQLLAQEAEKSEEYCKPYRFSMKREPTDAELADVMEDAARNAVLENEIAEKLYFESFQFNRKNR